MPFPIPTLSDLRTQGRANLLSRLSLAVPTVRRWLIGILAEVDAAMVWLQYGYLRWRAAQMLPDTAETDDLNRWGRILGLPRNAATPAAGPVIFTGTAGTPVPSGTGLQSSDGSVLYTTQAGATLSGTGTDIQIEATTLGSAGNAAAGASLDLSTAISGVAATVTVDTAGLTGGTDQETDAAYRVRVLARIQNPPQGGAQTDYLAWIKTVPQVTRAWVYPRNRGAGTCDVCFVCDGRTSIIPLSADITAAQTALNTLRPVTSDCVPFAPVADSINVTVSGLSTGTAGQAAVTSALQALFATTTPGGAAQGDGVAPGATSGLLKLNQISDAITQSAAGVTFDLMAPTADIASATGHIAQLGTVTFS